MFRDRKCIIIVVVALLLTMGATAQTTIEQVLLSVEENNASLAAKRQLLDVQILEERIGNSLEDPEVEFSPMKGKRSSFGDHFELVVKQEFDFPTVYSNRNKLAKLRAEQFGHEYSVERQQLLLQAQMLCIEISALDEEGDFLKRCLELADELRTSTARNLEMGGVSRLDVSRAEMEYLAAHKAYQMNRVEYQSAIERLTNLNGGEPLHFTGVSLKELPILMPLSEMKEYYLNSSPELLALFSEESAAKRDVKLSRSLSLPKIGLGYKQDYAAGEDRMHGVVISASIPLFANRHNVKRAKANTIAVNAEINRAKVDIQSTLAELYQKSEIVLATLNSYEEIVKNTPLDLFYKAYQKGQLTISEYYAEQLPLREAIVEITNLRMEYHAICAQINMIAL